MMDAATVAALSDADLTQAHADLSAERNAIVAMIQLVHDEQDRRLTAAAIAAELAALSPAARAVLLAGKG